MILKARQAMRLTNRLTTDLIIMYIDIPTDEGIEHYMVDIDRPDIDEDVYCISIYNLDFNEETLYSRFKINPRYTVLDTNELDEREKLLLEFIEDRLVLDEV